MELFYELSDVKKYLLMILIGMAIAKPFKYLLKWFLIQLRCITFEKFFDWYIETDHFKKYVRDEIGGFEIKGVGSASTRDGTFTLKHAIFVMSENIHTLEKKVNELEKRDT